MTPGRVVEKFFDENDYDRADKGTSTGGQFVAKNGQQQSKRPTTKTSAKAKKPAARKPPTPLDEAARRTYADFGTVSGRTPAGDQRVRDVQTLLRGLGYDAEDGAYGPKTEQAVRQLQAKLGVRQTGRVTSSLMRKMQATAILSPCAKESTELLSAERTVEADEPHAGAMVALVPSREDAERLAVEDGLPADELHVTLLYLGDGADFDPEDRAAIVKAVREVVDGGPVEAEAFAVSVFNPSGDEPCIVLGITGEGVAEIRDEVVEALSDVDYADQRQPWHAHLTLIYADDSTEAKDFTDLTGSVTFDRLRVAFAGEITDIPLGGAVESVRTEHGTVVTGRLTALDMLRVAEGWEDQRRAPSGTSIGGRWVSMGAIARLLGTEPPSPTAPRSTGRFKTRGNSVVSVALPSRKPRLNDRVRDPNTGKLGTVQATFDAADTRYVRPGETEVRAGQLHPESARVRWDDGQVEVRPLDELQDPSKVRDLPDPDRTFDLPAGAPPPRMDAAVTSGASGRPRSAGERMADILASGNVPTDTRREAMRRLAERSEGAPSEPGSPPAPSRTHKKTAGTLKPGDLVPSLDVRDDEPREVTHVSKGPGGEVIVHYKDPRYKTGTGSGAIRLPGDMELDLAPSAAEVSGSPAVRKMAAAKAPPSGDYTDVLGRLSNWDSPPSREEAHAMLQGLKKADLTAMAKQLNIPRPTTLTVADLRREIFDATAGRRLSSIATRGFTGARPGEGGLPPVVTTKSFGELAASSVPSSAAFPPGQHSWSGHDGIDVTDEEEANHLSLPPTEQEKVLEGILSGDASRGRLRGSYYGTPPDPNLVVSPEREAEIRATVEQIARQSGDRVGATTYLTMKDLRERIVGRFPRSEVDNVIQRLNRNGDWYAVSEANQKALTPRSRLAAVVIGNSDKHVLGINTFGPPAKTPLSAVDSSGRPVPVPSKEDRDRAILGDAEYERRQAASPAVAKMAKAAAPKGGSGKLSRTDLATQFADEPGLHSRRTTGTIDDGAAGIVDTSLEIRPLTATARKAAPRKSAAQKMAGPKAPPKLPAEQFDALGMIEQHGVMAGYPRTLDALERKGLIRRDGDSVTLTDEGRAALRAATPPFDPANVAERLGGVRPARGDRAGAEAGVRPILAEVRTLADLRKVAKQFGIELPKKWTGRPWEQGSSFDVVKMTADEFREYLIAQLVDAKANPRFTWR